MVSSNIRVLADEPGREEWRTTEASACLRGCVPPETASRVCQGCGEGFASVAQRLVYVLRYVSGGNATGTNTVLLAGTDTGQKVKIA